MTREEVKKRLEVWMICANCPEDKMCYDSYLHSICEYTDYCDEVPIEEAVKVAIKALEQEPILDKIRAEIMQLDYDTDYVDYDDMVQTETIHTICREEVLQIIDKYKAESEENNDKI